MPSCPSRGLPNGTLNFCIDSLQKKKDSAH